MGEYLGGGGGKIKLLNMRGLALKTKALFRGKVRGVLN